MSIPGRPRVTDPLSSSDVRWLVIEIDAEGLRARLAPYVDPDALSHALDAAFGVAGWGNRYRPLGATAFACELEVHGLAKSALAQGADGHVDVEAVAAAALTRAAALHRMSLPVDVRHDAWVDWDPEQQQPLYWPEPSEPPEPSDREEPADPPDPEAGADASRHAPPSLHDAPAKPLGTPPDAPDQGPIRSEGQRAIDKLVDRLREAGFGLEAAKLVNQHQGYGSDPDAARELYTRLRQLLLDRSAS